MSDLKVMIVDDSPEIRLLLSAYIRKLGCTPITAANGMEALKYPQNGSRPDLIFLDLMMPVLDGWETEKALALDPIYREIPTVVVTAYSERSNELTRDLEVIKKPLSIKSIERAIRRYCVFGNEQEATASQ